MDYLNLKNKGKGNKNADLFIVYDNPDFKDKDFVRQLIATLGIDNKNIFATPFYKDERLDKEEHYDFLIYEVGMVKPKVVWCIGPETAKLADLQMPFRLGYGMYVPFHVHSMKALLVPDQNMVGKMPGDVKEKFWERMQEAKRDFDKGKFERDAAKDYIKFFAKEEGFTYDESLGGPKTFWVFFDDRVKRYIIITQNKKAKQIFEKALPFGIIVTEEEMRGLTKKDASFILKVLKEFDGTIIDRR